MEQIRIPIELQAPGPFKIKLKCQWFWSLSERTSKANTKLKR
jgi:hypothetical protein